MGWQMTEHICPRGHKHGASTVCYIRHKCRCDQCRAANTARERRRRKLKAYGRWEPRVDAAPVRAHIMACSAAGIGHRTLAQRAGVSNTTIGSIIHGRKDRGFGPTKMVAKATAERILAVPATPEVAKDGARVPSRPTVLRLQALATTGHTNRWLAQQIGWSEGNLTRLINARQPTVWVATARAVRDLFDAHAMTPAPEGPGATRARRRAKANGWVTPLALDLDDRLDEVTIEGTPEADRRRGIDPELIEWAIAWEQDHPDDSRADVAARFGLTPDQLRQGIKARAGHGRPER